MKTNVTVTLDADLLREARVIAAEEGRSVVLWSRNAWNRWCANARRLSAPAGEPSPD
jgi:hypothetical protein